MKEKKPRAGYVRCEILHPILEAQIAPIKGMPTRRVLALLTKEGTLILGITAESAQEIAAGLVKAAEEMRKAS